MAKISSPDHPLTYLLIHSLIQSPTYSLTQSFIRSFSPGRTVQDIKAEAAEKADLGLIAESSRSTQRIMFAPPKLTIPAVFDKLKEIATMSGSSVSDRNRFTDTGRLYIYK